MVHVERSVEQLPRAGSELEQELECTSHSRANFDRECHTANCANRYRSLKSMRGESFDSSSGPELRRPVHELARFSCMYFLLCIL